MVSVYQLRRNKQYVENVQKATLTTKEFGIEQTHGLFGSEQWWQQVASGNLPVHKVSGVVTRLYMGSMNDWPEFSMRSDTGEESSWSRYANNEELGSFYQVGRPIEVSYVIQHNRPCSFDGGTETKCVIEVRIGSETTQ